VLKVKDSANNRAKESPLHLPKHDGRTNAFLCNKCNEDAENERCFAVVSSVLFMVVA
jgi:hypothetical protein